MINYTLAIFGICFDKARREGKGDFQGQLRRALLIINRGTQIECANTIVFIDPLRQDSLIPPNGYPEGCAYRSLSRVVVPLGCIIPLPPLSGSGFLVYELTLK